MYAQPFPALNSNLRVIGKLKVAKRKELCALIIETVGDNRDKTYENNETGRDKDSHRYKYKYNYSHTKSRTIGMRLRRG